MQYDADCDSSGVCANCELTTRTNTNTNSHPRFLLILTATPSSIQHCGISFGLCAASVKQVICFSFSFRFGSHLLCSAKFAENQNVQRR